jgi:adenylate kinase
MVKDEIVISIVRKEIESMSKERKSFILSGFPKTRTQALAMQRAGIFPDAFIILNMEEARVEGFCEAKFKTYEKVFDKEVVSNRGTFISNHALEYNLNIKQVKDIYKHNYFEIDCTSTNREEILESIAWLLKFKIKSKHPKRPACILIPTGDTHIRHSVARKLSQRYGFAAVSVLDLIKDQIAKNTEVGRLALSRMREGRLIEDNIVNGLVQSRLTQVDCQLQGVVLEGYPLTLGQVVTLKDVHLQPTMLVMLSGGKPLPADVLKLLSEKHEKAMNKLGALSEEAAFERICFSLENS